LRRNCGFVKLPEQVGGGVVGEAQASRSKVLIQNRRTQKMRHLLLFDGIARSGEDMAATVKHSTGDPAFVQLEESELALLKRELDVSATQLNAIGRLNVVERGRVDAQRI
jgi:hypothetical protein